MKICKKLQDFIFYSIDRRVSQEFLYQEQALVKVWVEQLDVVLVQEVVVDQDYRVQLEGLVVHPIRVCSQEDVEVNFCLQGHINRLND